MNDYTNPFVVAAAAPAARADFYRKTYMLVAASCAVFGLVLAGTLSMPAVVNPLTQLFFGGGALGWLLVLAAFWGISMLANRLAFGGASEGTQLAGLGIYIVAEALLFAPMLNVLMMQFGEATLSEIVAPAAVSTLLLAGGLTATVFMTKTDFSFLRAFVSIGFVVALGGTVAGVSYLVGVDLNGYLVLGTVAGAALALLVAVRCILRARGRTARKICDAGIVVDGIEFRAEALCDSGNALTDAVSGLPVIIVSESFAESVCGWHGSERASRIEGFVQLETVSGGASLPIVKVDGVRACGRETRAYAALAERDFDGYEVILQNTMF